MSRNERNEIVEIGGGGDVAHQPILVNRDQMPRAVRRAAGTDLPTRSVSEGVALWTPSLTLRVGMGQ